MNNILDNNIVDMKTTNELHNTPEAGLMTDEKMANIQKKKQHMNASYKNFLEKTISKIDYTSIREQWLYYGTILAGLIMLIGWIIISFVL